MTTETAVAQALGQQDLASNIVTLGAGVVALIFIFGFLFLMIREFIPAFKAGVAAMVDMMDKMSTTLETLNKTMVSTQANTTAALEEVKREVASQGLKLNYHIEMAGRIENQLSTIGLQVTQVQERVRNCTGNRPVTSRTRKEDNA